jgi:hypothetical protein
MREREERRAASTKLSQPVSRWNGFTPSFPTPVLNEDEYSNSEDEEY